MPANQVQVLHSDIARDSAPGESKILVIIISLSQTCESMDMVNSR
jgi:hypothetical protein